MVMCEKVCGLSLYWFTLTLHPEDSKSAVPIGLMCTAIFLFLVAMDIELPQGIQCMDLTGVWTFSALAGFR